jgi:diguanylate cyclase (GGDEF)-like protein
VSLTNKNCYGENDIVQDDLMRLQASFEAVETPLLVIDDQWQVVLTNDAAKTILGGDERISPPAYCYQLLLQKDAPCQNCPICEDSPTPAPLMPHAIQKDNGRDVFIKEKIAQMNGYYVLTLFDVSREITALKTMDLTRKELTAKTIMAEQRQRKKAHENHDLIQMIDQLPEALLLVDENFGIKRNNRASTEMFPSKGGATCYELFDKMLPCDGCPAEGGFENAHQKKKTHDVGGRYITETFSTLPEEGRGLLLFRETTRQIQLIEKIREQQETITRKNEILSSQVKLQTHMHKPIKLRDVLDFFLDVFLPICQTENGIVIINDIRKSSVWLTVARHLDAAQVNKLTGAYLSREVQSNSHQEIPQGFLPWKNTSQLSLIGGNGHRVGLILYKGSPKDQETEIIRLFSEPLGAFIHNKLLLRQLEEKANTDPLTGLYNRGYMDEALSAENEKYVKYGLHHAVLVADVNQLKKANDVYGHEAGDNLILTVSELLKTAARDTDIVARTGGDEFLILLTDTSQKGALELVDRLDKTIFNNTFMPVGKNEAFPITVSLGAAGTDKILPDDLIKTADQRMYEAKEAYYKDQERYR